MTLRWGIAGVGLISQDFTTALMTLPSLHTITAIASTDTNKLHEFGKIFKIKEMYDNYADLAKDENIDIIFVGVSNPNHFEITKLILTNNKHVLCEKPLCTNYNDTKTLIEIAKNKNLFLMEGMWSRFFPAYEALENHLQSGSLGEILQVNVEFGVQITEKERSLLKDLGGGVILDLGIYLLQFAQLIYKEEPEKILCTGHLDSQNVDESMSCILIYKNGRTATLTSHTKVLLGNRAIINGTNGSLKLETFWAPTVLQTSPANITEWQLPQGKHRFNFHNSGGLIYEAEECRKMISEGLTESQKMSHAESLLLAKMVDSMQQQIRAILPQD